MKKHIFHAGLRLYTGTEKLIDDIEYIDDITVFTYNEKYIHGTTTQYELMNGVYVVFHDLHLKKNDMYLPETKEFSR